jgi:large subunit ribosomal protein L9
MSMNVILLEDVRGLGHLGDKISVKPGYGRNYLIPQGKAAFATEANLLSFETKRAELEKKAKELLAKAETRATQFAVTMLTIPAMASDEGKLYGSITATDICNAAKQHGIELSKRELVMSSGPIYSIGEYVLDVQLHSDIVAQLKINIVASK